MKSVLQFPNIRFLERLKFKQKQMYGEYKRTVTLIHTMNQQEWQETPSHASSIGSKLHAVHLQADLDIVADLSHPPISMAYFCTCPEPI
jgi:hypothetical protein